MSGRHSKERDIDMIKVGEILTRIGADSSFG